MDTEDCVQIEVPELDRNYVARTLRSIALLKHVESKVFSEARQILPMPRAPSGTRRRPLSENDSRSRYPSSATSRTARLDSQTQQIWNRRAQLEKEVQQHIWDYAGYSCKALLDQMHVMLPRELRDIVYRFISGDAKVEINETQMNNRPTPLLSAENHHTPSVQCQGFRATIQSRGYYHLLDKGFSSFEVLREIAETWYSLATHRLPSPLFIQKFLGSDAYGYKLDPCALVKKLEIVHMVRDTTSESLNRAFAELPHLLRLEAGAKVQITLRPPYDIHMSTLEECTSIPVENLVVLFPSIKRLVEKGLLITMQFGSSFNSKVKLEELTVEVWVQKVKDVEKTLKALATKRHLKAMRAKQYGGLV